MTRRRVLVASTFLVAACALVYELALGTLASFTLGDAVTEFSITLGLYLFAMGIGALASKRVVANVARTYVACELLLACVGAASVPVVMRIDPASLWLRPSLYGFILLVGALVGVELPLLIRLQREERGFDEAVSSTLASDYVGALVASVLFPLVCVPFLGLVRTTLLTGALNAASAIAVALVFPVQKRRALTSVCVAFATALVALALMSDALHLVPIE